MPRLAHVELLDGKPIRIFKSAKAAAAFNASLVLTPRPGHAVSVLPRPDAVRLIRQACFDRCGGECEWCGKPMTWESCQMHEVLFRGKGGEISVSNSVAICYECHFHDPLAHGNRRLFFNK